MPLSAVATTWVEVTAATNIATGVDRVIDGQLMMVTKGTATTLVQVTSIVAASRRINFGTRFPEPESVRHRHPRLDGGAERQSAVQRHIECGGCRRHANHAESG